MEGIGTWVASQVLDLVQAGIAPGEAHLMVLEQVEAVERIQSFTACYITTALGTAAVFGADRGLDLGGVLPWEVVRDPRAVGA